MNRLVEDEEIFEQPIDIPDVNEIMKQKVVYEENN